VVTDRAGATQTGTLEYDEGPNRLTARKDLSDTTLETYGFDAQGNRDSQKRTNETSVTLTYDGQNRLSAYANPDASVVATYTYDATGQRTGSLVADAAGGSTATRWTYQGLSPPSSVRTWAGHSTWTITISTTVRARCLQLGHGSATPFGLAPPTS
jgi:YD repeat-containing protein